jgi:hypothetical protein
LLKKEYICPMNKYDFNYDGISNAIMNNVYVVVPKPKYDIGKSKNGKLKVLVFGDRNWGKDDRKRVRYVEDWRVFANGC